MDRRAQEITALSLFMFAFQQSMSLEILDDLDTILRHSELIYEV